MSLSEHALTKVELTMKNGKLNGIFMGICDRDNMIFDDMCTYKYIYIYIWLVVLTILKNISQWEGLSHILWKMKNV